MSGAWGNSGWTVLELSSDWIRHISVSFRWGLAGGTQSGLTTWAPRKTDPHRRKGESGFLRRLVNGGSVVWGWGQWLSAREQNPKAFIVGSDWVPKKAVTATGPE